MSYLQNELGARAWIGVPASYYRSPHIPPEFRIPGVGPQIFQRPVPKESFTRVSSASPAQRKTLIKPASPAQRKTKTKGISTTELRRRICPSPYNSALRQWELIPQAVSIGMKIFGGGTKGQKKAASQGRRSARAQKALTLLVPFSDLIDDNRWSQIGASFETAMQTGATCASTAALIVRGTPYSFAKQAADVILATSPGQIIEKRGGHPCWTALQDSIRREISQRQPDIVEPTARPAPVPRFAPAPRIAPTFKRVPSAPIYDPVYEPTYDPIQPSLPPGTTLIPTRRLMAPTPGTQIITVPTPGFMQEPAPVQMQAAIDPTWLVWGGLGLFAFMMLR